MIKKFLKDSVYYTIPTVLAKSLSIFLVPIYTRILAPADYGVIDMMRVMSSLIIVVFSLEISQGLARYIPEQNERTENEKLFSSGFLFSIISFSIFLLFSITLLKPITSIYLGNLDYQSIVLLAFIATYLEGLTSLLLNELRFEFKAKQNVFINVLIIIINTLVTLICLMKFDLGLKSIYYGLISAHSISFLSLLFLLKDSIKFKIDKEYLKELLVFSVPFVPSSIGVFLAGYIDRISVRTLMSIYDVGIYGVAFRFSSIVILILTGTQMAISPLIYGSYKKDETKDNIKTIFKYYCYFCLVFFITISLFSKEIFSVFAGENYIEGYTLVPILILSILFSKSIMFFPGLGIAKKTKIIAIINIIIAIVNLGLNYILIPLLGRTGAAIGTMSGALLGFVIIYLNSQKYYKIDFDWIRVIGSTIFSGCLVLFSYKFFLNLVIGKIVLLIFCISILSIIFIQKKDVQKILNLIR